MAAWLIRVIGKRRREIDKDLLVQALLALGRQLWEDEQAVKQARINTPGEPEGAA